MFDNPRTPSNGPSAAASQARDDISTAVDRGKSNIADAASAAGSDVAADLRTLRADVSKLQTALGLAAKDVGSTVATEVGAVASEVAHAATAQAKTFASELEVMARKNPLGTIASTLLVGVVIGMMSRGRS